METTQFSAMEVFRTMGKHKLLCALLLIAGMAGCLCYTLFAAPTLYESELRLALSASEKGRQPDYTYPQKAAATYVNIFQGNVFLDKVIAKSGCDETAENLGRFITISPVSGTGLIDVRIKADSPEKSLALAQTFSDLAEEEVAPGLSVGIYHYPQQGKRVSPGIVVSLSAGLCTGLAASLAVCTILRVKQKNNTLQTS